LLVYVYAWSAPCGCYHLQDVMMMLFTDTEVIKMKNQLCDHIFTSRQVTVEKTRATPPAFKHVPVHEQFPRGPWDSKPVRSTPSDEFRAKEFSVHLMSSGTQVYWDK